MIKRVLPLVVILVLGGISYLVINNPPQAQRVPPQRDPAISVGVEVVQPRPYRIWIDSYGRVRPRTQSDLLPQVDGEVVWIAPDFRAGGFFEAGDELLRIDDRDYRAALAQAQANLMAARQVLSEEQARSEQARADWRRLGNAGEPPALVVRLPQLNAARASLASAEAELAQARLDLERTRIRAPYAGRVLEKTVDLGQVVSSGTVLATLYAVDYVEVRLPIQSRDLTYIELPERYRYSDPAQQLPAVTLISDLIGHEEWSARVVQTEGAIDDESRQLHVLAQLDDPYGERAEGRVPLKIGQYVRARIQGRQLEAAIVVPNRLIYQGSYVYVEEEGALQRRDIRIGWQNEEEALVIEGLAPGDHLVTTTLGQVISGTPVRVRSATGAAAPGDGASGEGPPRRPRPRKGEGPEA